MVAFLLYEVPHPSVTADQTGMDTCLLLDQSEPLSWLSGAGTQDSSLELCPLGEP